MEVTGKGKKTHLGKVEILEEAQDILHRQVPVNVMKVTELKTSLLCYGVERKKHEESAVIKTLWLEVMEAGIKLAEFETLTVKMKRDLQHCCCEVTRFT